MATLGILNIFKQFKTICPSKDLSNKIFNSFVGKYSYNSSLIYTIKLK